MNILNYTPSRQVNFGWIGEAWQLFLARSGAWVIAIVIFTLPPILLWAVFAGWFFVTLGPQLYANPPPAYVPPLPGSPPNFQRSPLSTLPHIGQIIGGEIAVGLLMLVISAFFYGGLFQMAVRQVRGLPIEWKDVFRGGPLFGRMLGATFFLYFAAFGLQMVVESPLLVTSFLHPNALSTGTGLTLALSLTIVGSLVLACLLLVLWGLLLPAFALMADGERVFPALRRSIQAMWGQWLPATGFVVVFGLLVYASEIPCGLGLAATIPMVFLVCALAYRDMVGMPDMIPPPAPSYPPAGPGVWPPPPDSSLPPPPSWGETPRP